MRPCCAVRRGDGEAVVAALSEGREGVRWLPADATVADLRDDPDLNAEVQAAVDDANKAVSRAESIRKFRILDGDFTQEQGHLSAKLGIKRAVLAKEFAGEIEALYS